MPGEPETLADASGGDGRAVGEHRAGQERLGAEHDGDAGEEHRLPAQRTHLDPGGTHESQHREHGAEEDEQRARADEQQIGGEQQDELEVAPPIAESVQLRLTDALAVAGGHLHDAQPGAGGPNEHLGGQLHPGGPHVERCHLVAPERAEPRLAVVYDLAPAGARHEERECRCADEAMEKRHRPPGGRVQPRPEHQIGIACTGATRSGILVRS